MRVVAGSLKSDLASIPGFLAQRMDAFYSERFEKVWKSQRITLGKRPGTDALIVSSNDYLSLADHPDVIGAEIRVLQHVGHGVLQSGVFNYGEDELEAFETAFARLLGAELRHGVPVGPESETGHSVHR